MQTRHTSRIHQLAAGETTWQGEDEERRELEKLKADSWHEVQGLRHQLWDAELDAWVAREKLIKIKEKIKERQEQLTQAATRILAKKRRAPPPPPPPAAPAPIRTKKRTAAKAESQSEEESESEEEAADTTSGDDSDMHTPSPQKREVRRRLFYNAMRQGRRGPKLVQEEDPEFN
jgi:hypothetical protein